MILIYYKRIQTHTVGLMPIDLRRHDPDDAINIRPGTNKAAIVKLLYRNTNLAYTPAEIQNALDLPRGTTSTTLSRLHDDGLIGKTNDGLYHGLERRDDVRRFARSLVQLDEMADRYPEPGLTPDDVKQTGAGARRSIPRDRADTEEDQSGEEPAPADWVNSTAAPSTTESNTDADSASGDRE